MCNVKPELIKVEANAYSSLYLGNYLEQGFLLRLKTQLIAPESEILHN